MLLVVVLCLRVAFVIVGCALYSGEQFKEGIAASLVAVSVTLTHAAPHHYSSGSQPLPRRLVPLGRVPRGLIIDICVARGDDNINMNEKARSQYVIVTGKRPTIMRWLLAFYLLLGCWYCLLSLTLSF